MFAFLLLVAAMLALSSAFIPQTRTSSSFGKLITKQQQQQHTSASSLILSMAKQSKKAPVAAPEEPEPKQGGIEPKYLAALGVFLAACVFDYFRMHNGIAPWQEGGFLWGNVDEWREWMHVFEET